MPAELFDKEKFLELAQEGEECRVKRLKDGVKLKLRTRRRLYTMKVDEDLAEQILKELKCPKVNV